MAKRVKRKWGPGNPLWEWQQRSKKVIKRKRRVAVRGLKLARKRRVRRVYPRFAKARRVARRGRGIAGRMLGGTKANLSIKSVGVAALALPLVSRYQPFGGAYKGAVDLAVTGVVSNAVGMGNSDLISAGIKVGLAQAANQYLYGTILGGVAPAVGGGSL